MSTTDLIQRYIDIWNERDAAARQALMKEVLTDDVLYADPDYAGLPRPRRPVAGDRSGPRKVR